MDSSLLFDNYSPQKPGLIKTDDISWSIDNLSDQRFHVGLFESTESISTQVFLHLVHLISGNKVSFFFHYWIRDIGKGRNHLLRRGIAP